MRQGQREGTRGQGGAGVEEKGEGGKGDILKTGSKRKEGRE